MLKGKGGVVEIVLNKVANTIFKQGGWGASDHLSTRLSAPDFLDCFAIRSQTGSYPSSPSTCTSGRPLDRLD